MAYLNKTLHFLCLLVFIGSISAQNQEMYMLKYWKHRNRLLGDGTVENPGFVKVGRGQGMSLPIPFLDPIGADGKKIVHGAADVPHFLGHYIGVLSTEYKLLTDRGEDASQTVRELYYALEAYQRLDSLTNVEWNTGTTQLDGFFFRNDMSKTFHSELDSRYPGQNIPNFPGYDSTYSGWEKFANNRISKDSGNVASQDQIIHMIFGLSLLKKCIPPSLNFNNENILTKGQNIAHLMVSNVRSHNWRIKNPNNESVHIGADIKVNSYPLAEAANMITENDVSKGFLRNYHDAFSLPTSFVIPPVFIAPLATLVKLLGNGWSLWEAQKKHPHGTFNDPHNLPGIPNFVFRNEVTASLFMTYATTSGAADIEKQIERGLDMDMEIYPLAQLFIHDDPFISPLLQAEVENLLQIAPCERFCDSKFFPNDIHPDYPNLLSTQADIDLGCHTNAGWRASNRWWHPAKIYGGAVGYKSLSYTDPLTNITHAVSDGRWSINNGLDYMLLYNLYHLHYQNNAPYFNNFETKSENFSTTWPKNRSLVVMNLCKGCNYDPIRFVAEGNIDADMKILNGNNLNGVSLPTSLKYGNVSIRAGNSIFLTNGFKVDSGAYFRGYIEPFYCNDSLNVFLRKKSPSHSKEEKLVSLKTGLKIYPNPTSGTFKLEYGMRGDVIQKVEIYDSNGRLNVLKEHFYSGEELDIGHLANGMFLVKVFAKDKVESKRVILGK